MWKESYKTQRELSCGFAVPLSSTCFSLWPYCFGILPHCFTPMKFFVFSSFFNLYFSLQWLQLCRTDLKKTTSAYLNHKAFAQGHNCMWWLMVKPKGRTAGQLWSNLGLLREVFEQTGIKQTTFFQHIIIMLKINI